MINSGSQWLWVWMSWHIIKVNVCKSRWATETECGDSQSGTVCTSVQPQASSSSLLTVLRAGNTGTRWMATVKGYCYAIGYRVEVELAARVGRESGGER